VHDRREHQGNRHGEADAARGFLWPSDPALRHSLTPGQEDHALAQGTVKWFNAVKGYGFITQDAGVDVFVHYSSLEGGGLHTLNEGERVEFDVVPGAKGPQAKAVRKLTAAGR
jgi:CspA family cold shock protein